MNEAKLIRSRSLFKGKVVELSLDEVRLPNGHTTELEMIRHRGAAAVVPLDAQRRVLLVRQYRYATGGYLLEVPAGKLDGGEPPEACARRETAEEVGQHPGRLTALGWIWTTPGFTDEKIWLFLATELQPVSQELERHEVLTVERLPLSEAAARARRGAIVDAKTVCSLLRAEHVLR